MDNNTIQVHDLWFQEYISEASVQQKVSQLAKRLNQDYKDKNPIFIGLLNGCFIFAADLIRQITIPHDITFIKVSSYKGLSSTGNLHISLDLQESIQNRHVVIIEDIVDTGLTLSSLIENWKSLEPSSIEICSFLTKPDAIQHKVQVKYSGFEIPNAFVIGYGLDYDGIGRQYSSIYKLKE